VAGARLPVTVAADARATVVVDALVTVAVAIQRQAAEGRTAAEGRVVAEDLTVAAEGRMVAAVGADMEGKTTLDSFPA
jgi:hypothetical protein